MLFLVFICKLAVMKFQKYLNKSQKYHKILGRFKLIRCASFSWKVHQIFQSREINFIQVFGSVISPWTNTWICTFSLSSQAIYYVYFKATSLKMINNFVTLTSLQHIQYTRTSYATPNNFASPPSSTLQHA